MSATLKTVTLGCKVNQYETEYVREGLVGIGYRDAAQEEPADLCIVNTCTVTNEGDSKSRQVIRRLARDNPHTRIVVMGCYATRAPAEVAALPNVAEVVTDKRELPDLLGRFGVVDIPTGISQFGHRHRAYVKVQDGCLLRCSYCIIPKVRPDLYSRPSEHILDEVRRLLDNGYREIVLTGVHLGHYGVDWNAGKPKPQWYRLADLVRQIVSLAGDFRVRLSSIEATEVTRELVGVMAEFPDKVCPHLHICLQSGSDRILRRMKRRWGVKRFLDRCRLVSETLDRPALTTDVIVGFPGESDEDFDSTCATIREAGFSKIHTFPFSPRRGTPASGMSEMVPKCIKAERSQRLAAIESELREAYFRSLLGTKLRVLVEGSSERGLGLVCGTSCRYAPVDFNGDATLEGSLVEIRAERLADDRIVGTASF
ncbi:MAG: tRNA (N(6)-L-threonylcarbamoyladenosine(37)-C(2))-methylthiotransferase MtaB [Planctomycetaceae bacterium]|nr:tRNA (N(6)-L-threonylcarbamoyladenosine(37)-C(2))-methylthiotransferase MtaB [Planctomycetales bacterium]MCB9925679.1 tRNA (N(6)-L-threonylcarbamoyladenosine(37)-C(2))-methylthiotransferase MtaB [Planctomycetaceae bacterium]